MLEDIAASVLQRLLGRYVQGLEGRNLRVAVWSGRVVLENLMLRPEALAGLLPVHVREGFIGRIEMVVPWHKLRSLPVTIELQQVLVLAAPFNQREWTPSDETAYQLACKRAALHTRKRELQQLVEELKGQRAGPESELVPLLSRVVDNVQLTISGLHVRYEDATNVGPRRMCAMGLRLGAVRIKSVDECGRTRFVERTSGESVRKVVELDEISIYLDVSEQPAAPPDPPAEAPRAPRVAASASAQDLQAAFHTKPSSLLLRPLSGRAVLEFHPAAARPHWRSAAVLKVALEVVALRLTDVQCLALGGLLHYAQHHKKLHRRQRFASLRPADPPLVAPRLWWRYSRRAAYTEWAPKPARLSAKTLRARRAYMDGYREVLVASVVGAQAGAHVRVRLQELEDTLLNADQVVAFRALAAVCAQPALVLQQRKQQERLERKRRERERKAAEERRRAIERERREAEKLQREARRRQQVRRSPRPSVQLPKELQGTDEARGAEGEGAAAEELAEQSLPLEEGSLPPLRRESSARDRGAFDDKRRAVVLIQAHSRGRNLRAAYRRKQLAAPVLQALVRGVSARNSVQWRVQSATMLQRIWRGARERRAYGRLKRALLLDEDTACEVMRHVIAMIRRGRALGNSLEATHRAQQLFQHGLECNKAGLTLQACEYFQRAALCWKVGSTPASALNVLLSLANMYLKLGQPAPALMAYNYALQAKGASERHMEMARRKQQEALLLEKAQAGHASPSLMENDVALFAAGWIKYLDEQTTDGIHARDDMEPTGRASISSRDAGVAWPLGGTRALSLAAAGRSLTKGQRLLLHNLVMPLGSSGLAEASKPHERSQGGSGAAARAPPPGERLASRQRSSKALPASGSESEAHTAAPLELQLGASLEELSITLTHHDHPPEDPSGLLLLRMQKLELHHQRRSEGAMMLRMSANALDCYDLRAGASLHHHIVGAAGRRAHTSVRPTSNAAQHSSRQYRRRKPSSLSPPFVDRFRLPPWESTSRSRDPIADDGLKAFGGAMREKMGELSRRLRRRPTMDGAFGGEFVTEIVPAGPTKVVIKIRRAALTENSQRPRRLSQAADKIKDGLDKLRGAAIKIKDAWRELRQPLQKIESVEGRLRVASVAHSHGDQADAARAMLLRAACSETQALQRSPVNPSADSDAYLSSPETSAGGIPRAMSLDVGLFAPTSSGAHASGAHASGAHATPTPLSQRVLRWRFGRNGAGDTMSSAPAELLLVTTLQRHTRGWLARKGAALLRELRQLSLLCEELHRGGGSKRILQSDWSVHMWVSGRARQATNTRRVAKVCFTMPVATEVVIIRSLLAELSAFFRTPLTELSIKAASLYASGGADWAELLQRRPELQLSLDIRTPRIIIPLDTNIADGPLLALDMGRLTFASEGQKFTSDLPRGADEDFDFGAPSVSRSSNDENLFYDTFDAQVHNITAQLLASSTELQTASLTHTVIVERFQLGIRFQKCRLPASALRLVRSFREGGLPRVRLSFCTGRCVQVRLSARQWALLRGVKQDTYPPNTEQVLAADGKAQFVVQDLCNTGASSQTAAGHETCSSSSEQSTNRLGSANRPSPAPERRVRRRTPSYTEELLSSTLFRAASLVLTDYASSLDAELQALVVVPMFSVQLNYLPHGATEEAGLLECSLHDIRAEVTKSQHETSCDLQLQAMHARDLTDVSLPCLATSEPDYSRISSADPEASPSYRRERGRGVHGQETSPSSPSAQVPRKLVRVQIAQRTGRPARVNVQLNTFHFEWNAPCIATLKRFFGKPAPSGAGASAPSTGMPAPPLYGAGFAGHPPEVGVPPFPTTEEWHILDKAEGGETETVPVTRAVVNVVMTRLSLSLVQESSYEHSGAPLCVVTMKSLSFFTETAADGTLVMRGSIHSLRAHDVGRHRDFDTRDFPMLSIGSPQEPEPAMEFRYRKIFSVTKRPPAAHISYESELNMKVVALRVIWVQQWVVGAFEYLDNSILASVVRGVSDLSIERVWVPPNRWKPIRLNFLFTEARLVFPRSMNVLRNETMLEQHSIELASSRMSVTNTLERLELPGCEGRLLICDRVAIHFDQPQVTSRLDGEHRVSFGYPPEQACLTFTRSIERPHALVPAVYMACSLQVLHFDATLQQYELLSDVWKSNISRRGRMAAGSAGVWGRLTRTDSVKRNRFEAASLIIRVRAPHVAPQLAPAPVRAAGHTLMYIEANNLWSTIEKTHCEELIRVHLEDLRVVLVDDSIAEDTTRPQIERPLLESPWSFEVHVDEHFGGVSADNQVTPMPTMIRRKLTATKALRIVLSTCILHLLKLYRRSQLNSFAQPTDSSQSIAPSASAQASSSQPELIYRLELPHIEIQIDAEQAQSCSASRQPRVTSPLLQLHLSRVVLARESRPILSTEASTRVVMGITIGAFRVVNCMPGASQVDLIARIVEDDRSQLQQSSQIEMTQSFDNLEDDAAMFRCFFLAWRAPSLTVVQQVTIDRLSALTLRLDGRTLRALYATITSMRAELTHGRTAVDSAVRSRARRLSRGTGHPLLVLGAATPSLEVQLHLSAGNQHALRLRIPPFLLSRWAPALLEPTYVYSQLSGVVDLRDSDEMVASYFDQVILWSRYGEDFRRLTRKLIPRYFTFYLALETAKYIGLRLAQEYELQFRIAGLVLILVSLSRAIGMNVAFLI